MSKLPPKTYIIRKYQPNQPLGQYVEGTCLLGENVIFEADGYSRTFAGWLDLSETNANELMGYTAGLTGGSPNITFSSGTPANDFAPYQHVLLGRELYLIQKIDGLNAVIDPPARTSDAAAQVRRVPNLHAITRKKPERLSQYAGNAIRYREEAIFSAGRGALRISGSPISASLTATDAPQVAYPIAGGSTYDVRPVGFTAPTAPTVVAVAGGTKGMPAQRYSFIATKKRKGFPGFGLGSAPVEATLAAGQRFEVTFAAFDATEGQNSVQLWVSRTDDTDAGKAWYLLDTFDAVGPHTVEWYDGELGELYQIDNFPPPPCLFIESVSDHLLFVSCLGKPDSSDNPTAPGPGVAVAKPNNPEAASPVAYAFVTPASDVVGVKVGKVGVRATDSAVFFLAQDGISFGRFVDSDVSPLVIDPAGSAGVSHNYSAVFAYDYLYAFSGGALIRTVDGQNIEVEISRDVKTELATFEPGRTFVGFDQRKGHIVVFHSNDRQGSGGKWQTRALSLNLITGHWNTPCFLGDGATDDFTVCGVATVNQRLCFVTTDGKVWQWDHTNGLTQVSGYLAINWDDFGDSAMMKIVREVSVSGALIGSISLYNTQAVVGVYDLNNIYPFTYLRDGIGSFPSYAFPNPVFIPGFVLDTVYPVWKPNKHFIAQAWRIQFDNVLSGARLLNHVKVVAHGREGMSY